ncbi:hypothetical protein GECvBMG_gp097c [Salmonella phage GEC_vB_MG]|uniref:Uncharacterized protein 90 n=2 Tax=Seunavirus TaxID=1914851 RepID=G3BLV5_9CAUD|nr:hypothetical protein PVP-SE1_gp089 [Salmonella phage PVPSE1]YP_009149031.1 hypothetical protein ACQ19_gp235 [Salmonella phage SSE121]ADP02485.1 hypothetical protein [Salmonella phage PVPSE1]AFU63876.1 hypothetical protein [Salmonella phage SSE121]QPI14641.1 hypothetical protein GECvBMG_gp097c [Salmonella phage GEC_vB_MG]
MKDQTFDSIFELSDRDWPTDTFRNFYYHTECDVCGLPFMGPKKVTTCNVCKQNVSVSDIS